MAAPGGAPLSAQYFVKSLPGQPEGPLVKMHAGYVTPLYSCCHQHCRFLTPPLHQTHRGRREKQRESLLLALPEQTHREQAANSNMAQWRSGVQQHGWSVDGDWTLQDEG